MYGVWDVAHGISGGRAGMQKGVMLSMCYVLVGVFLSVSAGVARRRRGPRRQLVRCVGVVCGCGCGYGGVLLLCVECVCLWLVDVSP